MKNKSGFISMSLVYSFLIIFLFLMTAIIDCYLKKNTYLEALDKQVSEDIGITQEAKSSIFKTILEDNIALRTTTLDYKNISNNSVKNGNGLYYVDETNETDENDDGYGTKIYFYRGAVDNNNVIFGSKVTRKADGTIDTNKDMCWKIIRTNEDGSVRLIYNGLANNNTCPGTTPYIGDSIYNYLIITEKADGTKENNYYDDDNAYVGFTYGSAGVTNTSGDTSKDTITSLQEQTHYHIGEDSIDSDIKKALENFFVNETNLYYSTELNYKKGTEEIYMQDEEVANAVYCNNRSIYSPEVAETLPTDLNITNSKLGYGIEETLYDGVSSIMGRPSYVCKPGYNRYTLSTIMGGTNENFNALDYAIGLPTVDDIVFAGGAYQTENNGYYLKTGAAYWTMTPAGFINGKAEMFYVDSNGQINKTSTLTSLKVRPVISVEQNVLVKKGIGTKEEPYILK